MDSDAQYASALATLNMLKQRLHRLEFLLHGSSDVFGIPEPAPSATTLDETVAMRLANIESDLRRLASRHPVVQDILDLRMKSGLAIYTDLLTLPETRIIQIYFYLLRQTTLQRL